MLERDYDIIHNSLDTISIRHSYDDDGINPYKNINKAQRKCNHMWPNDTDAIFTGPKGKRKCAICGKEF